MTAEPVDPEHTIQEIVERLGERFPHLGAEEIREAVLKAHDSMDDVAVRDFVPVLVEKRARKALKEELTRAGGHI